MCVLLRPVTKGDNTAGCLAWWSWTHYLGPLITKGQVKLFFYNILHLHAHYVCICLFSALSRRVGALQISIIIIIIVAIEFALWDCVTFT